MKLNILLVGDYSREDFLYAAKVMHNYYNIYFLEFLDKGEVRSTNYKKWGKAVFWKDYTDALDLIEKIKPKKILFYFIESLNHVALNVACKHKGIRTYHIEHGIRDYEFLKNNIKKEIETKKQVLLSILKKVKNGISRIKNRQFFLNTIKKLSGNEAAFLKEYFQIRGSHSIFETFHKVKNTLRVADCYISFSPKIFEFHQISDHLPTDYPIFFIGCPAFDYLADLVHIPEQGEDILFIDQSFERQELFGWNEESKKKFLEDLVSFTREQNKKIWIKKHPYSMEAAFQECRKNDVVNMISDEAGFRKAIGKCKIIIGFFSTLLMPFMAMDHTVCLSLEMHPSPAKEGLSSFLVDTGAIKRIDTWEHLKNAFENLDEISREQKSSKKTFIENWLYKFDGKSTERLRNILLNEN